MARIKTAPKVEDVIAYLPRELTEPQVTLIDELGEDGTPTGRKVEQLTQPTRIWWLCKTDLEGNIKVYKPLGHDLARRVLALINLPESGDS